MRYNVIVHCVRRHTPVISCVFMLANFVNVVSSGGPSTMERIVIVGVVVSKTTGLFVVKFIENQYKNADGFIILHQLHFANSFFTMIH